MPKSFCKIENINNNENDNDNDIEILPMKQSNNNGSGNEILTQLEFITYNQSDGNIIEYNNENINNNNEFDHEILTQTDLNDTLYNNYNNEIFPPIEYESYDYDMSNECNYNNENDINLNIIHSNNSLECDLRRQIISYQNLWSMRPPHYKNDKLHFIFIQYFNQFY